MKALRLKVSVPGVFMFNLDPQKLVCEVLSADALFLGNDLFTYTQVYKFNDGS